jgi:hypothetical protein
MIGASTGLPTLGRLGCLCPDWDDLLSIMAETLFREIAFLREMRAYLCRVREQSSNTTRAATRDDLAQRTPPLVPEWCKDVLCPATN